MTILTIWRHGAAEDAAVDRDRELTVSGRDDVGFGCHQFHHACLARRIAHPDHILHSPWVRTAQTAEIVASAFTHAAVTPEPALQPGSKVGAVDRALSEVVDKIGSNHHLLLVTHQPLVSQLLNHYLGAAGSVPPLPPGGLATLSLDMPAADCGKLLFWAFPPEFEVGI